MQEATINFQNREQANQFTTAWAFKSKMGHVVSGNSVTVWNVTDELQEWIDDYVYQINAFLNFDEEFEDMNDDEILEALGM